MAAAELNIHFLNSVVLTALVASFVLWRYRSAVLAGMMRGDATVVPLPATCERGGASLASGAAMLDRERMLGRRIALGYLLSALICSIPLAYGNLRLSAVEASPAHVLLLALAYSFACAPMIIVSLALPPLRALAAVSLLAVLLTALAVTAVLAERTLSGRPLEMRHFELLPLFFATVVSELWMAAALWLLTWPARLRGVAPITFAALLVFGLAPFAGSRLTAALAATEAGTQLVYRLGLNGVFVLLALPAGWLAWKRLQRLARDYEAKRFSDAQLLSYTWWLMLVATVGLGLVTARGQALAVLGLCVGVALVFMPLNRWLLRRLGARLPAAPARTLLLLRKFGHTARTERLFDRIGARWRLLGPVTMIAAPDVVARTIDAGDYLRWLTGRIDELFVTSRAELDAKLGALDTAPDPDGRYRVNEFCCRDNTWQATVVELMQRADVVLMDVRGVTRERRGCEFELQQLAHRLPPQRLVLVVDAATDRTVLDSAFGPVLAGVRLVELRGWRAMARVFEQLCAASCTPDRTAQPANADMTS